MGRLFAGVAKVDLTSPVGGALDGYPDREIVSQGVHDQLHAKALVLYDGNEKVVIITSDLIGYDESLTAQTRKLIEEMTTVKGKNIMIAISHTHSAPSGFLPGWSYDITSFPKIKFKVTSPAERWPPDIEAYRETVVKKVAGAVYEANNRLAEARIGVAKGVLPTGVICTNRHEPAGIMDPEVSVIRVDDSKENVLGVLVNYTCHPTIMGAANYFISGDFPGAAMETIENACGKGVVAMFVNGACGNISPRYARREQSFREVERMGKILAGEAIKTLYQIKTTDEAKIRANSKVLELPRKKLPPLEKAREAAKRKEAAWEGLKRKKAPVADIRTAEVEFLGADMERMRSEALERGVSQPETVSVELQEIHVNDTVLVGVPGELFVELGLQIKRESGLKNVIVVGYANGSISYILTPEAYETVIYERFQTQLTEEGGPKIVETALELIKEYHG